MIVGFACGVFDLFHAGHVMMLRDCREQCEYLLVALNKSTKPGPGKNVPVFSIEERKIIVESCKYVDEVITYDSEEELLGIMRDRKIHVRFLGEDYREKPITGADLDIPIIYIRRDHGYSTSSVRSRILKS